MPSQTAQTSNNQFERRASEVRHLAHHHRQFEAALEDFAEFDRAMREREAQPEPLPPIETDLSFRDNGEEDPDGELGGDRRCNGLMIVGPSGAGKSTLLREIRRRPELQSQLGGAYGDKIRFAIVTLGENPTPKGVVADIFTLLDSAPPKGWTRAKIGRELRKLFADIDLQYLAIEEAHEFVEGQSNAKIKIFARLIKFLLIWGNVPIILCGEEPLEDLLSQKAFQRRFFAPIRLGAYTWRYIEDVQEFMGLAAKIVTALGFDESALSVDFKIAMRLYLDTDGVVGFVAKRLIEAGRAAHREGARAITTDHLSKAWLRWQLEAATVADDPFDVVAEKASSDVSNPYSVSNKEFKALWQNHFLIENTTDTSRETRRHTGPKAVSTRGFRH